MDRNERLANVVSELKRGDQTKIAKSVGVGRRWVCEVMKGKGVSEKVMQAAEQLIQSRKNQSYEATNN